MSTGDLESIGNLRNIAYGYAPNIRRQVNMACDEIEGEIAKRYMELPLDADGVPIRLGDTVREVDDRVPMEVMSLTFYEDCVDVNTCGMNPNLLRHVKPRTIEDVLEEFLIEFDDWDWNTDGNDRDNARKQLFAKYAEEIRGMMA